MIQFVGAGEARALAGNHDKGVAAAGHFAAAFPDGDIGFVAGRVNVDAVFAGTLNLEGGIRSIDLEVVSVIKMAHAKDESPLRQAQLGSLVVEIEKSDTGFRIQAHRGGADLELSTRIFVGPEIVAVGKGTILDGGDPVTLAAGLERDRAIGIAQAGDAAGRVLCWRLIGRRWLRDGLILRGLALVGWSLRLVWRRMGLILRRHLVLRRRLLVLGKY